MLKVEFWTQNPLEKLEEKLAKVSIWKICKVSALVWKIFFTDIEVQERQDFYRRNCGQNSAAELKRQSFGLAQTRFVEIHESEFKDFTNKNSRHKESLFSQGQRERSAQENCRLVNSQPAILRVNSTGALDKPLPRTTLVKKVELGSSDY